MHFRRLLAGGLAAAAFTGLTLAGAPAQASDYNVATFAYPSAHNFCPAGTQPTYFGAGVGCMTPTSSVGYHQAMPNGGKRAQRQHSAPRASHANRGRLVCPAGEKECFYE